MKKFLILLFLMAIGTSVYGQTLETSSNGYTTGYLSANSYYTTANGFSYYNYFTEDGVLYSASKNPNINYYFLVKYPASKQNTSFSIPAGTYRICRGAFQGNKYIQTIRIPSTVKYIGDNAFDGCESLTSIEVYEVSSAIPAVEMDEDIENFEKKEIGRYNINGVKVEEKDGGIQIILYSDGSADKVLEQP